jgi:hypothetical protein
MIVFISFVSLDYANLPLSFPSNSQSCEELFIIIRVLFVEQIDTLACFRCALQKQDLQ